MNNKNAFSLIEIIIATGVITISIFGIYKIIGENKKLINISNNNVINKTILPISENCIENKKWGSNGYINFGENLNECNYSTNISTTSIDNIDYIIKYNVSSENYIIEIVNDFGTKLEYKIKK